MFRVGLLVNGLHVSGPVKDLIDWAETQPDIEIAALLIHPEPPSGGNLRKFLSSVRLHGLYRSVSKVAFAALNIAERQLVRSEAHRKMLSSYDVGGQVPTHVKLEPIVSKSGLIHRFSPADVQRVKHLDLDVLIRGGAGILKGDILNAAKAGVLSLHHGDNRINRGGPPGFWEVVERRPATGFIVQRLTDELDGGDVLCRGEFATRYIYSVNQAALLERANLYLKRTLRDVLEGRAQSEPGFLYYNVLYRAPLLHQMVQYLLQTLLAVAQKGFGRITRRRWRWSVGYTFAHWRKAVLWRSKVIPNPPGRFLADPFVVEAEDGHYLFVEDYSYTAGKAGISAYKIARGHEPEALGLVLDEPFHLSFPFVFRYSGNLYMVPETADEGEIRLYRCTDFPLKWEHCATLFEGITATDTIIFEHSGRWWLLTNVASGLWNRNDAELHIYFSDNPISGWQPHARNPVVTDLMVGRNGGLLLDGDDIYRVAQRPGYELYGEGYSIRRIVELSEDGFRDEWVQNVEPNFFPHLKGTHHLHQAGDLLVFDFLRRSWFEHRR